MSMSHRSRAASSRLNLESLEDRTLMSTCHVTRLGDDGNGFGFRGDFRYCINKVNVVPGPDIILFRPTAYGTINLTGALPDLASDIEILGPGSELLTLRRNTGGNYRILTVPLNATIKISGLTMKGGFVKTGSNSYGGGIFNAGFLTIRESVVAQNTVTNDYNSYGGGIYNTGTLTIDKSLVTANNVVSVFEGAAFGGGIYNDGSATIIDSNIAHNAVSGDSNGGAGIFSADPTGSSSLSLYNSTVSSNRTSKQLQFVPTGGGILSGIGDTLVVVNSTIHQNEADFGAGLIIFGSMAEVSHTTISGNIAVKDGGGIYIGSGKPFHMRNTIVGGNSGAGGQDILGTLSSSSYNLIGDSTGGSGYDSTDILDVDPLLGTLQDNGGPTETMALLPGSPAIDAGDNTNAPAFDQRGPGFSRIVNDTIDIGAFEVQATGAPGTTDNLAVLMTADLGDPKVKARRLR